MHYVHNTTVCLKINVANFWKLMLECLRNIKLNMIQDQFNLSCSQGVPLFKGILIFNQFIRFLEHCVQGDIYQMKRSHSRSSLFSVDRSQRAPTIDPAQLSKQVQCALNEASRLLSHEQFSPLYFKLLKGLIKRAETESVNSQGLLLETIIACVQRHGCNLELQVRTLLLEVLCELNSSLLDRIGGKLEKIKHTVIDSSAEYLLAKAFLLQQRWNLARGDEAAALNSLRKCIQLTESHMSEYIQESEEVRQEIVDYVILANYEMYRLRKTKRPAQALQNLAKALSSARKSYGVENGVVKGLQSLYGQQQHLLHSIQRMSSKERALTEITEIQFKKHYRRSAFYSWQDEKIVAQLLRVKDGQRQVLHEISMEIKLDMGKIKLLKEGEWLVVQNGKILICEDEILRLLGVGPASQPNKEMTTRIEMRNLSRDLVIRKEELSSSDDNQDLLLEELRFLKHPRAQSSRKFKETH